MRRVYLKMTKLVSRAAQLSARSCWNTTWTLRFGSFDFKSRCEELVVILDSGNWLSNELRCLTRPAQSIGQQGVWRKWQQWTRGANNSKCLKSKVRFIQSLWDKSRHCKILRVRYLLNGHSVKDLILWVMLIDSMRYKAAKGKQREQIWMYSKLYRLKASPAYQVTSRYIMGVSSLIHYLIVLLESAR